MLQGGTEVWLWDNRALDGSWWRGGTQKVREIAGARCIYNDELDANWTLDAGQFLRFAKVDHGWEART
jgi:GH43 family beta-xylosidase